MTEPPCAGCGGSPVVYRNFAEQPLCAHCCECSCGNVPCSAPQPERPVRHTADTINDNDLDALYSALDEARSWARHGYEIGQRSCTWADHGVAPAWLTEGWPMHLPALDEPV